MDLERRGNISHVETRTDNCNNVDGSVVRQDEEVAGEKTFPCGSAFLLAMGGVRVLLYVR
jgi:hypothetical protein